MTNSPPPSDLPAHARERLQAMRGKDEAHRLFTSDLTVNEFLLVKEAGFDPVGMVVGCSMYHIGYQWAGIGRDLYLILKRLKLPTGKALKRFYSSSFDYSLTSFTGTQNPCGAKGGWFF
ncbi:hypothetical protein [Phormidesmis priestleyi]|uniref:hypothetical protein n=1 Tax=Phormidesmis priestleyi TaxID=268141 RepID=UPI00083A2444|nr:hypothetical protein [Phormidesmis priestleyi]